MKWLLGIFSLCFCLGCVTTATVAEAPAAAPEAQAAEEPMMVESATEGDDEEKPAAAPEAQAAPENE